MKRWQMNHINSAPILSHADSGKVEYTIDRVKKPFLALFNNIFIRTFKGLFIVITTSLVAACSPTQPLAPTAIIPTFNSVQLGAVTENPLAAATKTMSAADQSDSNGIFQWGSREVGAKTVALEFYTQNMQRCLRVIGNALASPIEKCAGGGSTVAVQTIATDESGEQYTVIGGRVFSDDIVVVSIELDKGDSVPVDPTNGGFIAVLPGIRRASGIIPINNLGNLVGQRYSMP